MAFGIRQGEVSKRFDPSYYSSEKRIKELLNRKVKWRLGKLKDVCSRIIQPKEFIREYVSESNRAAKFLRAANTTDGELHLKPYLLIDKINASNDSKIEEGDILITRTGANAGATCAVRELPDDYFVSSHSIRMVLRSDVINYLFLEAYLLSSLGKMQINRLFTGAAQKQLQITSISEIGIFIPPLQSQQKLSRITESAREVCKRKHSDAEVLLSGIDNWLIELLGITFPKNESRNAYAVRLAKSAFGKQLGADYYHPERINALKAIKEAKNANRVVSLGEIVNFVRDTTNEVDPDHYVGLANIESNTGELITTNEETGKGQCFLFQEGDVLFGRLRPYLNKVWASDRGGFCSPEFHVMRIKSCESPIHSDYLATALRSSLVVAQTKHMMTGNTHPRLANQDVVDLLVPIPDEAIQAEIVSEIQSRRAEARRLKREAEELWQEAKSRFELELLREA